MSNPNTSDKYYPESLIKAYFNWCAANDHKASFPDLHKFVAEIMGDKHINFIPYFRTIEEVFHEEFHKDSDA